MTFFFFFFFFGGGGGGGGGLECNFKIRISLFGGFQKAEFRDVEEKFHPCYSTVTLPHLDFSRVLLTAGKQVLEQQLVLGDALHRLDEEGGKGFTHLVLVLHLLMIIQGNSGEMVLFLPITILFTLTSSAVHTLLLYYG